ncbi:MAG: glycosyltransferase [Candidatus Scalinduaceae bacterium]
MKDCDELYGTLFCFKDTRDVKGLVRYYLDHLKKRKEIAQKGHREVLEKHTKIKKKVVFPLISIVLLHKSHQKAIFHVFKKPLNLYQINQLLVENFNKKQKNRYKSLNNSLIYNCHYINVLWNIEDSIS